MAVNYSNLKPSAALDAAAALLSYITRFIVPPTCMGCGRLIAQQALCPVCWKRLHFISQPFCRKYAVPFSYESAPGILSPEAYRFPPPWHEARAAVRFEDLGPDLVHGLKYADRHDYAPLMGRLMAQAGQDLLDRADIILPVPMHWRRLLKRRYNQAALLARVVAAYGKKEYQSRLLIRARHTPTQVGLSRDARMRNLRSAFQITDRKKQFVKTRNILLVDDVMTSGATLAAATHALTKAGAGEVNVLIFARVTEIL